MAATAEGTSSEASVVETATCGFLKKSAKLNAIPLAIKAHLSMKSQSLTDISQSGRPDVCQTCGLLFQVDGPEYKVLYRRKKRLVVCCLRSAHL